MTSGEKVELDFVIEGNDKSTVKNMNIDMIHKSSSPFWVTVDEEEIPHFLRKEKYVEATCGWYYDQTQKSVKIKYPNKSSDYKVVVSFTKFDLLGM